MEDLSFIRKNLTRVFRILWNILIVSDASRQYPYRALEIVWTNLPHRVLSLRPVRAFGKVIHGRACVIQKRTPEAEYTRFLRNPPQLEVLRDLVLKKPNGSSLKMAVLGCSTGAELYSALWMIRSARPELNVVAIGLDISDSAIKKAREGEYSHGSTELEGLSEEAIKSLFVRNENSLKVQKRLKEGVSWRVSDARNPRLQAILGFQDIVFANNFLCHMPDSEAADCLRNVSKLVAPGGYLFVWGVDLDVRTEAVRDLGLIPVTYKLEEVYNADKRALEVWPLKYWGLEPLDKSRSDWQLRYATVFQVPPHAPASADVKK